MASKSVARKSFLFGEDVCKLLISVPWNGRGREFESHQVHQNRPTIDIRKHIGSNIVPDAFNQSNLFVISGGPGAGKTTVLRELASRGFPFAPEIARQIIQEQVQSSGTALPWEDREAYTLLMLKRSVESYLAYTPASRLTFSDRGIPDTLCYARLIGLANQKPILDACRQFRYAPIVFLAPPWREIYKTDGERKQDFAEAETTFEQMVQVYRECGYGVSVLPKSTPQVRADFILQQIQQHSTQWGPARPVQM